MKMQCPVCGDPLHGRIAMNSLSRADNETYICSPCGTREALIIGTGVRNGRRMCLYFDTVAGIALVTEDEPGYYPFGTTPPNDAAAAQFCDRWNRTLGLNDTDVSNIVGSSMFGRWVNF